MNSKINGITTPINLVAEGWGNWTAQWRPNDSSSDHIDFEVDDSQASQGRIGIFLSAANSLLVKNGVWDLQATRGEEVKTWIRGEVTHMKDVTRVS
jgi:hypothetical protein